MSAPSFPQAWEKYWLHLRAERQLRQATVGQYREVLYLWHGHLGERPWWKATTRQLDSFTDPGKLAPATRAGYISVVCGFYRWATAKRLIPRDPMAAVRIPRRRPPVAKSLPLADVRTIQMAADHDERLRVAVALAYFCGMRAGELAHAQVADVHLHDDQPRIEIPEGKGGRSRVVPLHPEAARILAGYLSRRSGTGPLLESRRYPGRPLQPNTVSSMLKRLIKGVGIAGSAHSLRHSAATELLRASKGQAFEATRAFLGHTDGATTRRYVASYDFDVAEAVAAMPDPRAGNGSARGIEPTGHLWLPTDLADQLGAALKTLDAHGEAVATAMEAIGKVTTAAWLHSLGITDRSQLPDVDPDALDCPTDAEWERFELESGIRRGWTACDRLRDAHPDG